MQVPGAVYFRPKHRVETQLILLQQHPIVQSSGGMNHASKRRHGRSRSRQRSVQVLVIADVSLDYSDPNARPLQPAHSRGSLRAWRPTPDQNQMSGAAAGEPLGHEQTESAQTAGNQV